MPKKSTSAKNSTKQVESTKPAPVEVAPEKPAQSIGKSVGKKGAKKVVKKTQKAGDSSTQTIQVTPVKVPAPTRHFKCIYKTVDNEVVCTGRYSGKKPKQAACKALTAIIKSYEGSCDFPVKFLITECTRNSKKKMYSYSGSQQALDKPVEVKITRPNGKEDIITYKRSNVLKKVALTECSELINANVNVEDEAEEVEQTGGKTAPVKKKPVKKVKAVKIESKAESVPVVEKKKKTAKKTVKNSKVKKN